MLCPGSQGKSFESVTAVTFAVGPYMAFITSWCEMVSFLSVFVEVLTLSSALCVSLDDHWFFPSSVVVYHVD